MFQRSSLAWPIVLVAILVPLIVALMVIWIVNQTQARHWVLLVIGVIFITLILAGVVAYFYWTVREMRLNRRQANFLDAVTHELKSPIASLKLCLQTLDLRSVTADQSRELHRYMLEDIQRLDGLIDHMLMVARLGDETRPVATEVVSLPAVLQGCAEEIRRRYQLDPDQVQLDCQECTVRCQPKELEMVFMNLLDNAVKYGGEEPQVRVDCRPSRRGRVIARISDNGSGVGLDLRHKIFQRFYRGGSELERTTKGTGLGLHIVKSLVGRMRGRVSVHGRGPLPGATFEVDLPLASAVPVSAPSAAALGGALSASSTSAASTSASSPSSSPAAVSDRGRSAPASPLPASSLERVPEWTGAGESVATSRP
ncbi:MAG: sensor histidine kinase [Planctomycetaceae bacterium]|jgi:two-component system phosphate regulon sensor histidine kinase PhoR